MCYLKLPSAEKYCTKIDAESLEITVANTQPKSTVNLFPVPSDDLIVPTVQDIQEVKVVINNGMEPIKEVSTTGQENKASENVVLVSSQTACASENKEGKDREDRKDKEEISMNNIMQGCSFENSNTKDKRDDHMNKFIDETKKRIEITKGRIDDIKYSGEPFACRVLLQIW